MIATRIVMINLLMAKKYVVVRLTKGVAARSHASGNVSLRSAEGGFRRLYHMLDGEAEMLEQHASRG